MTCCKGLFSLNCLYIYTSKLDIQMQEPDWRISEFLLMKLWRTFTTNLFPHSRFPTRSKASGYIWYSFKMPLTGIMYFSIELRSHFRFDIENHISSSDHNQPFIIFSVSSSLAADQFDKSTGPDTWAMPSTFTGTTQLPKRYLFTHLRVYVANAAWWSDILGIPKSREVPG